MTTCCRLVLADANFPVSSVCKAVGAKEVLYWGRLYFQLLIHVLCVHDIHLNINETLLSLNIRAVFSLK